MSTIVAAAVAGDVVGAERRVETRYLDPLDLVWLAAAERMGMSVRRSAEAYASWDGRGTLLVTTPEHMDADDCLAQMILHEACHALVAGPEGWARRDWGLDNETERDVVQEHATNRLQAWLADRYGLRAMLATTTEFRAYYDALPEDPLADDGDPAVPLAREGYRRARTGPWGQILERALVDTAALAVTARAHAPPDSLWSRARPLHALGFALHRDETLRCGDCAWAFRHPSGRGALRCRHSGFGADARPVDAGAQACVRWERPLAEADCGACGACCREGFDLVQVRAREPFRRAHPDLLAENALGLHVPRPGGRCVALEGDGASATPYRCRHYAERPRSCADFPVGGDACLEARRRVRLSR